MDDFSKLTACVVDLGIFHGMALRLARDFGRVLYYKPWKGLANFQSLFVGDGFQPKVHRIKDLFDVIDDVDLFVFPYVYDGDLQLHLEKLGKRVWGSRKAENLEFRREIFKRTLEEVGLPVPEYEAILGMTKLRDFLEEHSDEEWAVKRDLTRGDGETFMAEDIRITRTILNTMDAYYAEAKDEILFIVEKKIETDIEVGYDGICIDGQYTDGFVDYEIKNRCTIAAWKQYDDMNKHVRLVNEKFSHKLSELRCRSMWGTEIRVDKKGDPYFIDATARMPSPPGELLLEMVDNLAEVMWHGSVGEFVQAKSSKAFGVQVMMRADWEDHALLPVLIPKDAEDYVILSSPVKIDGVDYCIQCQGDEHLPWMTEIVGAVVGTGDTIEEAIESAKEHGSEVKGLNLDIDEEALAEGLAEILEGQEKGIEFSDDIPEPATVIED
jgi:hypothetical protein